MGWFEKTCQGCDCIHAVMLLLILDTGNTIYLCVIKTKVINLNVFASNLLQTKNCQNAIHVFVYVCTVML